MRTGTTLVINMEMIRFRIKGPAHPPSRQQRHINVDRGRYGPPNRHDNRPRIGQGSPGWLEYSGAAGGGGNRGGRRMVPAAFARNPKFPKSMYDVERGLRQSGKAKPIKLTPGMSFPDPKTNKSISNPRAPRLKYSFEPTAEDYNIIRNPIAGIDDAGDDTRSSLVTSRYMETSGYNISSDDSSDDDDSDDSADGGPAIPDNVDSQMNEADEEENDDDTAAAIRAQQEELLTYSYVNPKAQRVREAQVMGTQVFGAQVVGARENHSPRPPLFEPQPPPPRAPVEPVLVIPRAVVREEELQRYKNGDSHDDNNNVVQI